MNCDNYIPLLSARLDEELSPEEAQLLDAHLMQCPHCRMLWEQLLALHTSFSSMEELSAPEGFSQSVMARISPKSSPKNQIIPLFRRPRFRVFTGAAACALLCFGLAQAPWKHTISQSSGTTESMSEPESVLSAASEAAGTDGMEGGTFRSIPAESPQEFSLAVTEEALPSPVEKITSDQSDTSVFLLSPSNQTEENPAYLILSQLPFEEVEWLRNRPCLTDGEGRAHYTLSLEEGTSLLTLAQEQNLDAQWKNGSEDTETCILILNTTPAPTLPTK